jgi:hypothetical protein
MSTTGTGRGLPLPRASAEGSNSGASGSVRGSVESNASHGGARDSGGSGSLAPVGEVEGDAADVVEGREEEVLSLDRGMPPEDDGGMI